MTTKTVITQRSLTTASAVSFVQRAGEFRCEIKVVYGSARVSAKSLLSVSSLCIMKGDRVTLVANGTDEKIAVEELSEMLT